MSEWERRKGGRWDSGELENETNLPVQILKRCYHCGSLLQFLAPNLYELLVLVPSSFSLWLRVSSSILPSLCFSSEDDVMPEAMCEMPVLSPQVMVDGCPSHTKLLEGLHWNERSHSDMGHFFGIFDQLIAVNGKVETNVLCRYIIVYKMLLVAHIASLQTCCKV